MQVLADEFAHEGAIRVNSLNPGATRTPMRRLAYPRRGPSHGATAGSPLGPLPLPAQRRRQGRKPGRHWTPVGGLDRLKEL